MKLLDSNILIYSYSESFDFLRPLILEDASLVSEITRLEVLGFHGLTEEEQSYFNDLFSEVKRIDIDKLIIEEAINLRQSYKMKLADSIIAATAIVHHLELYTRNEQDFRRIPGLEVINPVDI